MSKTPVLPFEFRSRLQVRLRHPTARDGAAVHRLIAACRPLDTNSMYCNLLQCTHFAQTSVLAEADDGICGFVSGYTKPAEADVLFIWQVAVAPRMRGCRLGATMINHLIRQCVGARYIETSITAENDASWALFKSIARTHDATLNSQPWFGAEQHFAGDHDDEFLVRIGPFANAARHTHRRGIQLG